ncbi:MAG: hypothetical protein RL410_75 [Actinomycetota bacterium]|jgi:putative restriction endonuclease
MDVIKKLITVSQASDASGGRKPNKPLLLLLSLSKLALDGTSELKWTEIEAKLNELLEQFGQRADERSAAYPFTLLTNDGIWHVSEGVNPNASPKQLQTLDASGALDSPIENWLLVKRSNLMQAARAIAERQFPDTLIMEVLSLVGLDPYEVMSAAKYLVDGDRKRDPKWPPLILENWNFSCAFCGYDGKLNGSPVAIEAAHIHWFSSGGPDDADNGLALCSLHHKLLDRGVIGFVDQATLRVSPKFTSHADYSPLVSDLHGLEMKPLVASVLPKIEYINWHTANVYKHGHTA